MDTLTIEVFAFNELGEDAKEEAIRRLDEELYCKGNTLYYIKECRYRFYSNGVIFDALGCKE